MRPKCLQKWLALVHTRADIMYQPVQAHAPLHPAVPRSSPCGPWQPARPGRRAKGRESEVKANPWLLQHASRKLLLRPSVPVRWPLRDSPSGMSCHLLEVPALFRQVPLCSPLADGPSMDDPSLDVRWWVCRLIPVAIGLITVINFH